VGRWDCCQRLTDSCKALKVLGYAAQFEPYPSMAFEELDRSFVLFGRGPLFKLFL
jgi:hypothetical protein